MSTETKPTFDFSALTDDALEQIESTLAEAYRNWREKEQPSEGFVAGANEIVDRIEAIRAERDRRSSDATAGLPEGEQNHSPVPNGTPDANASPKPTAASLASRRPQKAAPKPKASSNVLNFQTPAGRPVPSLDELGKEFATAIRSKDQGRQLVASASVDFPEDRLLNADVAANSQKIEAVTSPAAIVAAGGLCAPLEPKYSITIPYVSDRPVRDAIPRFGADRGGIRFVRPPMLADFDDAVGRITVAQDEAGTLKTCAEWECDDIQEETVSAFFSCNRFGNFDARFFPEKVAAYVQTSMARHARLADSALLDAISDDSTAVTSPEVYSASRTLLGVVSQAAAGLRSRLRLNIEAPLRALLPGWTADLLRSDLARGDHHAPMDPFAVTLAMVRSWFRSRDVNVTFYLDEATGADQIFGTQGAGQLRDYPDFLNWFLFPEGSFLFLDGGRLDLGVVRDSTLNAANQFEIFTETFEGLAFVGVESLEITTEICSNGAYPPAADALMDCAGS